MRGTFSLCELPQVVPDVRPASLTATRRALLEATLHEALIAETAQSRTEEAYDSFDCSFLEA